MRYVVGKELELQIYQQMFSLLFIRMQILFLTLYMEMQPLKEYLYLTEHSI